MFAKTAISIVLSIHTSTIQWYAIFLFFFFSLSTRLNENINSCMFFFFSFFLRQLKKIVRFFSLFFKWTDDEEGPIAAQNRVASLNLFREPCIPLFHGSFYFPTLRDNIVLLNKGTNDTNIMIQFIAMKNEYYCLSDMKSLVHSFSNKWFEP